MGPYEQLFHILNFMAPAWCMALLCALCTRVLARFGLPKAPWSMGKQVLANGLLGVGVLLGGLALWGVEGKMATWGGLVLVSASTQWLMCQAWRR